MGNERDPYGGRHDVVGLRMRSALFVLMTLPLFAAGASDDVYRDAGAGAYSFLKTDLGARSAAMGGTGVLSSGGLAVFSNPAMLADAGASGITAGHNRWLGDAAQSCLAWNFSGGRFSGAVGIRMLNVSGLEYRDEASSEPLDTFSAMDLSINAAAAVRLGMFDLGMAVKAIREKIWLESSSGMAFDVGVAIHPAEWLDFAAAVQHIGPKVTMVESEFRLPLTWRLGASCSFDLPLGAAEVAAEVRKPLDNSASAGAGLEYSPAPWVSLRGGARLMDETGTLTAGAGFSGAGWTLDYAWIPTDYGLGAVHRFTLGRSL
jgi:hypothetical protein